MQVYAVIAGINWEGENSDTLKIFAYKKDALSYEKELKRSYDYVEVVQQPVLYPYPEPENN